MRSSRRRARPMTTVGTRNRRVPAGAGRGVVTCTTEPRGFSNSRTSQAEMCERSAGLRWPGTRSTARSAAAQLSAIESVGGPITKTPGRTTRVRCPARSSASICPRVMPAVVSSAALTIRPRLAARAWRASMRGRPRTWTTLARKVCRVARALSRNGRGLVSRCTVRRHRPFSTTVEKPPCRAMVHRRPPPLGPGVLHAMGYRGPVACAGSDRLR